MFTSCVCVRGTHFQKKGGELNRKSASWQNKFLLICALISQPLTCGYTCFLLCRHPACGVLGNCHGDREEENDM